MYTMQDTVMKFVSTDKTVMNNKSKTGYPDLVQK